MPRLRLRLSIPLLVAVAWALPGPAATLHVVVAADRAAPGIGADMALGRDAVVDAVINNTPEAMCDVREVPARGLGRASMLAAIRGLRVGPGDAILFYYLGHGAYSPRHGTYTLASGDAGQGGLFLSEIRAAVAAKRPRFGAVVLECCNNLRPLPGESFPSKAMPRHPEAISPLFDDLFFGRPGLMTVTSSAPSEYAIVLPTVGGQPMGPLFTNGFTQQLRMASGERVGWDRVLARTQEGMDAQFRVYCRGGVVPLGNGQVVRQARQTITSRGN